MIWVFWWVLEFPQLSEWFKLRFCTIIIVILWMLVWRKFLNYKFIFFINFSDIFIAIWKIRVYQGNTFIFICWRIHARHLIYRAINWLQITTSKSWRQLFSSSFRFECLVLENIFFLWSVISIFNIVFLLILLTLFKFLIFFYEVWMFFLSLIDLILFTLLIKHVIKCKILLSIEILAQTWIYVLHAILFSQIILFLFNLF